MSEGYISTKKLAEHLCISRRTIYHWIKKGTFPKPAITTGGISLWCRSEIAKWERENRNHETEKAA